MESMLLNLTKTQRDTIQNLNDGNYKQVKMANVTRLLNKVLKSPDLAKLVLPEISAYQMSRGMSSITEVQKDLSKRIKNPQQRAVMRGILTGQTDNRAKIDIPDKSKAGKPNFDTEQSLDDLLDSLTTEKPREPQMKAMGVSDMFRAKDPMKLGRDNLTDAQRKQKYNEMMKKNRGSTRNRAKDAFGKIKDRFTKDPVYDPDPTIGSGKYEPEDFYTDEELAQLKRRGQRFKPEDAEFFETDTIKRRDDVDKYEPKFDQYDESKHDDDDDEGYFTPEEYVDDIPAPVKPKSKPKPSGGTDFAPMKPSKGGVKPTKGGGTKTYEPYSGKAHRLTQKDLDSGTPATMEEFLIRNGRKGKSVDEEDLKAYKEYIESAKKGIEGLQKDWDRIQKDKARNRKLVEEGKRPVGKRFTDANDPLGIMRGMGYEFESDLDEDSVKEIAGSAFHSIGDVARMIPGIGEAVGSAIDVLADIAEAGVDWINKGQQKAIYDHSKFDFDEWKSSTQQGWGMDGDDSDFRPDRQDKYYRPNWKYNETYLPSPVDRFNRTDPYNKGLQEKYLAPLEKYSKIYQKGSPDFIDSVTPEQQEFLKALKKTIVDIKLGKINLTHKQYSDLIRASMNEFTPEQRSTPDLMKLNEQVVQDVKDVYLEGKGKDISIPGDIAQFAEKIINDVEKAAKTQADIDTDPEATAEVDIEDDPIDDDEPDEQQRDATPEKEEEEDDKPEEEDKPKPQPEPKPEVTEQSFFNDFGHEPKYRPRGQWGGTDELFEVLESDKQKRNLVLESSTLNEGIDRTNPFFKRQQIEYDMRYRKTFPMPQVDTFTPQISEQFIRDNRSIWNSGQVPTMRRMENSMRNPYDFGQYQVWEPKYDYNTERGSIINNTNYFPSISDQMTHGEPFAVEPITTYQQMIMNQRWVR